VLKNTFEKAESCLLVCDAMYSDSQGDGGSRFLRNIRDTIRLRDVMCHKTVTLRQSRACLKSRVKRSFSELLLTTFLSYCRMYS